mgnify:CR=1 FL=1
MKDMKNIKPLYAVKLGSGVFAADDGECPNCGMEGVYYFDSNLGCYVCSNCDYRSKPYY